MLHAYLEYLEVRFERDGMQKVVQIEQEFNHNEPQYSSLMDPDILNMAQMIEKCREYRKDVLPRLIRLYVREPLLELYEQNYIYQRI